MNQLINHFLRYFSFLLLSFVLLACGEDNEPNTSTNFDRRAMLEDVADDLIIPNFRTLQASVNQLSEATDAFTQASTEANLLALREAWKQAVIDHQHCSAFGFGPANLLLGPYAQVLGVFPVNESRLEELTQQPSFDLANSFERDIRGFYAVEYLIYGHNQSNSQIVSGFANQNRKNYLRLIVSEIKTSMDGIVNEWTSTYRQEFIENSGTSAGSSISLYYNDFVKDYENLKNFKLELPAGLTAGQSGTDGRLVEAFYSGISRELVAEHFANSKNIWLGQSRSGQASTGFEEYLLSVVGGPELVTQTKDAIGRIDNAISALPQGRLSDNIGSSEVRILRDLLQDNTANFKSSMSSLLGISITFNSGDGD
ncbi:MAG: imelysin family protein [Bernardetiaceae bacterium]